MLLEGRPKPQIRSQQRKLDSKADPYADGTNHVVEEDNSRYMFGPDILVTPFYNRDVSRRVKLPAGDWYDFHTGKLVGGGRTINVTARETLDLPPLFVRGGALIPMLGRPVNRTDQIKGEALEVRLYGCENASCEVYEDDGLTYDSEKGAYSIRRFVAEKQPNGEFMLLETLPKRGTSRLYGEAVLKQMTPR